MTTATDVVIIGAGCMGLSIAHHLARSGVTDVVVLDRGEVGGGSTSKGAGGFRMQFTDELNVQLSRRSLDEFVAFEEITGESLPLRQVGYLFVLDASCDVAAFRAAVAMQRSLGVPSEMVDIATVSRLVPQLHVDDLVAATFCPLDGYTTPEALALGYAAAARRLGVTVRTGCDVIGVERDGTGVSGVVTENGTIATRAVVCTAGVGSAGIGELAGIPLPVEALPRWIHFSPVAGGIADDAPMVVDFASSFYFHREGAGMIFGGREATLEEMSAPAVHRLPVIADLPIRSSWWGNYEVSPDHNALVGEAREVPGFFYATGFSGHGFQQAPAIGEHVAALVRGEPTPLDLGAFEVERFAGGQTRAEHLVI